MKHSVSVKAHWSFWLIAIFMLIWNVLGSVNLLMQLDPEMVSSYRDNEQAIIQGRPLWATIGFVLSVFGGAIGCLLLLIKEHSAFYIFIVSLVGTVVAAAHSISLGINYGAGEIIGIILMPVLVSLFLVWYTKYTQGKGWLKTHNNLSKRDAEFPPLERTPQPNEESRDAEIQSI
jgi:hypothetical protein